VLRELPALVLLTASFAGRLASGARAEGENTPSVRMPDGVTPVIVAWFWFDEDFQRDGYRPFLDMIAEHSGASLLMTSLRAFKKEVTDEDVHAQIRAAAAYARRKGIRIAMDLDVRLARAAFQRAYPDELQEMLRLREVDLKDTGAASLRITSDDLNDHYTGRTTHYVPLAGRLVRVYSYARNAEGIDPQTVVDITARCRATAAAEKEVVVEVPCDEKTRGRKACVMVSFTQFAPDVFAPHLDEFQVKILEQYRDTDVVGACKDEWGFPPCFDGCPAKNDYWYSRHRAEAYARRTAGRDLLRDCLLMTYGERGRQRERQAAINQFLEMSTLRNGAIEAHFYRTIKAVFGPGGVVATHPTWYPYPGTREFKKNGLDWWIAPRDMAQTDEVTPHCVRTSLAKKWNSPLWVNMYYSSRLEDYDTELWADALSGGRIDYHPVYPLPEPQADRLGRYKALLRGGLMRGDCRVRMLNFITRTPLDCPVAVIFGHACAMNWAGPAYDDVGIALTDRLWQAGYPADLIPSSEIGNGSLKIDDDGHVRYGPQRYRALVLYHPEFERPTTATFFQKAADGKTALYRAGSWTRDFDGRPFDGDKALPVQMAAASDPTTCTEKVIRRLRECGVEPQTPANRIMTTFSRRSSAPPRSGRSRLIDGTEIMVSGTKDVAGDPIQTTMKVAGHDITFDAIGVVGVRLDPKGQPVALAAGGLKRFEVGAFRIELPERVDLSLWRDPKGLWQGVLQSCSGPVPAPLAALTDRWLRMNVPAPLP
jgi:hypothetical protein